jgi:hypothetical protein
MPKRIKAPKKKVPILYAIAPPANFLDAFLDAWRRLSLV